jgi:hypothetical protein
MKIDRYDIVWFMGWEALLVMLGFDAATMWFLTFGWLITMWFGEPLLDRWADRIVSRERSKVWPKANR